MKSRSLLVQVLFVNLLLVAGTAVVALIALEPRVGSALGGREVLVLGLALLATLMGNWLLLRRRFIPLDRLISAMEQVDLASANQQLAACDRVDSAEAHRLEAAINRMLTRLEASRRDAGRAAVEAQERERRRIAQDLHDEVNQALTAVSLRLQASIEHAPEDLRRELTETKRLAGQAMEELLALARQLRPAVLDDLGLLPALKSQVRDFADQTGIQAVFNVQGPVPELAPEQQLVVYRVTQESLSNVAQHSGAGRVDVELSSVGRTILRVRDDGQGFSSVPRTNGRAHLGLSGMRERALLVGGRLNIYSEPGEGTTIELTMEGR
ncbi:MAG TPA: sensor histidine kinase [Solirubrobacteraceae bacterium]|nr:sensor histidine kinase [Solirubrobacteraceae bacterium]